MIKSINSLLTRGDKILIISLLILSFSGILLARVRGEEEGDYVLIEARGKIVKRVRLNEHLRYVFKVEGPLGFTTIEIYRGKVRVLDSPCPYKICEKMGWIKTPRQMIVCLPNEVIITVESGDIEKLRGDRYFTDLDAVSR